GGVGFGVRKSGHASVALVGFPSVGKSMLLNQLTGADSAVGAFEFTTLSVIPGMMEHCGAQIQILDIPGLVRGAASGKGRGREVISVVRNADMILFVLDVFNPEQYELLGKELYDAGIRVNSREPDVVVKRKIRGGISVNSTLGGDVISHDLAKSILSEYKIHNADVLIREDITVDQFIDAIHNNRHYVPGIVAVNKVDVAEASLVERARTLFPDAIMVSAIEGRNINILKDAIFNALDFIRIYLKPRGADADLDEPLIVRKGCDVGGVCDMLHRDFRQNFRYAHVWGNSAKHPGQRVGIAHILDDSDVLRIVM
ncbi:GTP-binding protein, partial [Methanosarcinales archaeon]